jgi:hypothetical protein
MTHRLIIVIGSKTFHLPFPVDGSSIVRFWGVQVSFEGRVVVGNEGQAGGELDGRKWWEGNRVRQGRYTFDRVMVKGAREVACGGEMDQYGNTLVSNSGY